MDSSTTENIELHSSYSSLPSSYSSLPSSYSSLPSTHSPSNHSPSSSSSATPTSRTTDELLWLYVSPVILFLGLCGNLLILLVINRRNLRGTTTCVYLTALSIFDTLALVSGIVPEWTHAGGFSQFNAISSFSCQLEKFVFYTTSDAAIWILVIFTLDRFVAVCFPFYKRSVCVPKRSKAACAVIFVLAFVKNFHVFWTRSLVGPPPSSCGKKPEFKHFESAVRPWIAFATISVLPFIILVVSNSMIIWTLARMNKSELTTLKSQSRSGGGGGGGGGKENSSGNVRGPNGNRETPKHPTIAVDPEASTDSRGTVVKNGSRKTGRLEKHGGQSYRQTTMMCLSASIAFLLCIFPSIVMLIGKPHWSQNEDGTNNLVYDICKAINNQLAYLNHSINFFLYCVTGRKFRQELVRMFKEGRRFFCCRSSCSSGRRCDCCSGVVGKREVYNPSSAALPSSSTKGQWRKKNTTSVFVTSDGSLESSHV